MRTHSEFIFKSLAILLLEAIMLTPRSASSGAEIKKTLLVAPLEVSGQEFAAPELSKLTSTLLDEVGRSHKYLVQDQSISKSVEKAKKVAEACKSAETCAIEKAREMEIELVLLPQVNCFTKEQCNVRLSLIDIQTQKAERPSESIDTSNRIGDLVAALKSVTLRVLQDNSQSAGTGQKRFVRVETVPSGARLIVDTFPVGETPWQGELEVGMRDIYLSPPSQEYNDLSSVAEVKSVSEVSGTQNIRFVFAGAKSRLRLDVVPQEAVLKVNGLKVDFLKAGGLVAIPSGKETTLELSSPSYAPYKKVFSATELVPGIEIPVGARLDPLPGRLLVTSNPSGAAVCIDGEFKGQTPLPVSLLADQDYKLAIASSGFSEITETVRLFADEKRTLSLKLTPGKFSAWGCGNGHEVDENKANKFNNELRNSHKGYFGPSGEPSLSLGLILNSSLNLMEDPALNGFVGLGVGVNLFGDLGVEASVLRSYFSKGVDLESKQETDIWAYRFGFPFKLVEFSNSVSHSFTLVPELLWSFRKSYLTYNSPLLDDPEPELENSERLAYGLSVLYKVFIKANDSSWLGGFGLRLGFHSVLSRDSQFSVPVSKGVAVSAGLEFLIGFP